MNKKQYILTVLEKVSGFWSPASNLRTLVIEDQLTDEYINYLYNECVQAVGDAINTQNLAQQEAIVSRLNMIKETEIKQNLADQKDINQLEALITML